VGALATVDGAQCVGDRWSSTSPDPMVRAVGEDILAIDRTGGDSIRVFAPGSYETPLREFVLDPGANIHDVLAVGDERWFAPFERSALLRADRDGNVLGTIDLSPWADSDGLPEIDRLLMLEDLVYVGLQRLDRPEAWTPLPDGLALGLLPDGTVLSEVVLGPNPKLSLDPRGGALLALTGDWSFPDGALVRYDPSTDSVQTLLTEQELGFDLGGAAGLGHHLVLLGADFVVPGPSRLACYDLDTGALTLGRQDSAWPVEAVAGDDAVYVAVRMGWGGEMAREVWKVDPVTCEDELFADAFTLDPFALAWVGSDQ
jgi:hypothetical protein